MAKRTPQVTPLPTNMKLKNVSKSEFLEIRKKQKAANAAAEEARRKVLGEAGLSEEQGNAAEELEAAKKNVTQLKAKIKKAKASLEKKPDSEKLKKNVADLEKELDEAEAKIDELEAAE